MKSNKIYRIFLFLAVAVFLTSCQKPVNEDVYVFINNTKAKPPGTIPPIKRYPPYKPYSYSAQQLRSPFLPPAVIEAKIIASSSNVKPDLDRQKQRLESFDFSSLSMVGTVSKGGVLWALVRDPEGSIERVKAGYYIGKNHGKITNISDQDIDVVEIVSNGSDGWIERPNLITIKEK